MFNQFQCYYYSYYARHEFHDIKNNFTALWDTFIYIVKVSLRLIEKNIYISLNTAFSVYTTVT